jgi:hypothetical protein
MTTRKRLELTIREISSECAPEIAARRIAARIEDAICLAVAEEREACAALAEGCLVEHDQQSPGCRKRGFCECYGYSTIEEIAAAIRARKP